MKKPEKVLATIAAWVFIAFVLPGVAVGALASMVLVVPCLLAALVIFCGRGFYLIIQDNRNARAEFKAIVDKIRKDAHAEADKEEQKRDSVLSSTSPDTLRAEIQASRKRNG